MFSKRSALFLAGILAGFLWFGFLHFEFDPSKAYLYPTEKAKKDAAVSQEHYMNDNAPLSTNRYIGDRAIKEELAARLNRYQEIRNYEAYDYSIGQTKGDIFPDLTKPLIIKTYTESGGLAGDSQSYYYLDGKVKFRTYSRSSDQKFFIDAKFLKGFLKGDNINRFEKSLAANMMDLNSFVEVRIEHGKHTYDNMDPNYFSSSTYANRMRTELDTLNYSNIIKLDNSRYELINEYKSDLPLMLGFKILKFRSILTFNSDNSFTLERSANKMLYFKIVFHNKPSFQPFVGASMDLEELDYNDEFVSPDKSF